MEDVPSNKQFHLVRGFPIGMLDQTGGTWDPGTDVVFSGGPWM